MGEKEKKPASSLTIKELKGFLNSLPSSFDDYEITNGEYGKANDENYFRIDKPVIFLSVDEDTQELCILHQSEDEINDIITNDEECGECDEPKEDDK